MLLVRLQFGLTGRGRSWAESSSGDRADEVRRVPRSLTDVTCCHRKVFFRRGISIVEFLRFFLVCSKQRIMLLASILPEPLRPTKQRSQKPPVGLIRQ